MIALGAGVLLSLVLNVLSNVEVKLDAPHDLAGYCAAHNMPNPKH